MPERKKLTPEERLEFLERDVDRLRQEFNDRKKYTDPFIKRFEAQSPFVKGLQDAKEGQKKFWTAVLSSIVATIGAGMLLGILTIIWQLVAN